MEEIVELNSFPELIHDENNQWTPVASIKANPECNITCDICHKTYLLHSNYIKFGIKACVSNGGCCTIESSAKDMLKLRKWTFISLTRSEHNNKAVINFICEKNHTDDMQFCSLRKGAGCKTCIQILRTKDKIVFQPLIRPDCNCRGSTKTSRPYACPHYNFKVTCPDASADWDYSLNKNLDPTKVAPGSQVLAWFRCPNKKCGEAYEQTPNKRTGPAQQRCPYCAGQKVAMSNCLLTKRPDIAAQWDSSNTKSPTQFTEHSKAEIVWKCDKHGDKTFTWPASIAERSSGSGCPKCNQLGYEQRVGGHEVFVADSRTIHGDKYQYPEKYINATTKINIYCPVTEVVHGETITHGLFSQTPNDHKTGYGCPKCGLPGYNQIIGGHDYFVKEARLIHGDKYEYPDKYDGCDVKINIYCKIVSNICGTDRVHGFFKQTPHSHKIGGGCPICSLHKNKSKGVIMLYSVLNSMGYILKVNLFTECTIPGLQYRAPLRLDGYLTDTRDNLVTEYDGRQHFKIVSCWGGVDAYNDGQYRDLLKDKFCVEHKINLLRIPYTVKPSVEMMTYFINLCREGKHIYVTYQKYYDIIKQYCGLSNVYVFIWPMKS